MLTDLRYALRMLRRQPGFTAVALVALALGIGANTAIFSIVNGVLLRPLPYPDPDRLVQIWRDLRLQDGPAQEWASAPVFFEWQAQTDVFERVAAVTGWGPSLTGAGDPERVVGAQVSRDYFEALGARPVLGRGFTVEEDRPDGPPVVALSGALWRRLGADPDLLGATLVLDGVSHAVVGVLPDDFRPAVVPDAGIFRPLRLDPAARGRNNAVLLVIGRLRLDMSLDDARARLDVLARRLEAEYPATDAGARIALVPLHEQVAGPFRPALLALLGAVVFVLLIACANVANLLLARASARGREVALRAALGAGRWRLARQLLTEALVLAAGGSLLGVLMAAWGVDALVAASPVSTAGFGDVGLDLRVLGYTALVTVLTGLAFGLAPFVTLTRLRVTSALKDAARGSSTAGGRRVRGALVVAEVAVSLVLLVGAGLLVRSFVRLLAVDPGYRTDHVLTAPLNAPASRYAERPQIAAFYDRVLDRAHALPGVRRAALVSILPLVPGDNDASFSIEGRPAPANDFDQPVAWYRMASPGYFDTMGIRLVRGRGFTDADGADAPRIVIINEALASRYWPGEDPVGRRVRLGGGPDAPPATIVGVVGDVLQRGLDAAPVVEMYIPYRQIPSRFMTLVLWTDGEPGALAGALRSAMREIDPNLPLTGLATMDDLRARAVAQPRFLMALIGAFALTALMLAAIGIYGVVSYGVTQRTSEIGIRMALGADRRQILALVVGGGFRLVLVGVALGVAGAAAVTRGMTMLLFEVTATDPWTFAATTAGLAGVAALASLVPALHATKIDPMVALREE